MPALFALLSVAASTLKAVEIPTYIARDVRLVGDAADLPSTTPSNSACLYLASIEASTSSGDEIAEGPYIDAKTGQYVEPPGSKFEVIMSGQIKVDAALFGPAPFRHMPYRWAVRQEQADPEDAAYYSPFRWSGLAILGYNDDEADSRVFQPTYLVPSEWEPYIAPAYAYARAHPSEFDPKRVASDRNQLRKLLAGTNPVLAVFAARALCEARGGDWDYVLHRWSQSQGICGAAILLLVLETAPASQTQTLPPVLATEAQSAGPLPRRVILLAAVAGLLKPRDSVIFREAGALLDAYKAATIKAGHPYGSDPESALLLQFTGR